MPPSSSPIVSAAPLSSRGTGGWDSQCEKPAQEPSACRPGQAAGPSRMPHNVARCGRTAWKGQQDAHAGGQSDGTRVIESRQRPLQRGAGRSNRAVRGGASGRDAGVGAAGRAAERVVAQVEAAALAPWKAGIAQALMARGLVLAGRREARQAEMRNDPIGGRAAGGGGYASGVGAQRP
jgi:hypothetical protein